MSEAWVVNASPLMLFSRIARLDLLERLAPRILIPNAVIEEVRAGQQKDQTAARALEWGEATLPIRIYTIIATTPPAYVAALAQLQAMVVLAPPAVLTLGIAARRSR